MSYQHVLFVASLSLLLLRLIGYNRLNGIYVRSVPHRGSIVQTVISINCFVRLVQQARVELIEEEWGLTVRCVKPGREKRTIMAKQRKNADRSVQHILQESMILQMKSMLQCGNVNTDYALFAVSLKRDGSGVLCFSWQQTMTIQQDW